MRSRGHVKAKSHSATDSHACTLLSALWATEPLDVLNNRLQHFECTSGLRGALFEASQDTGLLRKAHQHFHRMASGDEACTIGRQFSHSNDVRAWEAQENARKDALDADASLWARADETYWSYPVLLIRLTDPRMSLIKKLRLFQQFLDVDDCCLDAAFSRPLKDSLSNLAFTETPHCPGAHGPPGPGARRGPGSGPGPRGVGRGRRS